MQLSTVSNQRTTHLSKLTEEKRAGFCEYLRAGWSITAAAGKIGVARQSIYALKAKDVAFACAWDDAYESGTDLYEDEAKRRAVEGTDKPVFYRGEKVGHIREYSDTLLIFTLKARRPDKYRERVEQTVKVDSGDDARVLLDEIMSDTEFRVSPELAAKLAAKVFQVDERELVSDANN